MAEGDDVERSAVIAALRNAAAPGTFEHAVLGELQVIRVLLVRVVSAIGGDVLTGNDGLVSRMRLQTLAVADLERRAAAEATAQSTKRRTWAIVGGTVAATGAAIAAGREVWSWFAH